ncbi:FMN-binding glutamate synthase family protein, partial [Lysobacter sp. D1-1-M9]
RWKGLDVTDKAVRVQMFHRNTVHALAELLAAAGLTHPREIGPEHILRRLSAVEVRSLAKIYRFLEPGELLKGVSEHAVFKEYWADARSDSFVAPDHVRSMRESKSF